LSAHGVQALQPHSSNSATAPGCPGDQVWREFAGPKRRGERLGFRTQGLRLTLDQLQILALPAILHCQQTYSSATPSNGAVIYLTTGHSPPAQQLSYSVDFLPNVWELLHKTLHL